MGRGETSEVGNSDGATVEKYAQLGTVSICSNTAGFPARVRKPSQPARIRIFLHGAVRQDSMTATVTMKLAERSKY